MLAPDFKEVSSLLSTYIGKRPRRGPFPIDSALTWSILLSTQSANRISGQMLEIGVEFGTSAFLMLESLRPEEHATFIDVKRTEEWLQGIGGPYQNMTNHSFIIGNTLQMRPQQMPSNCRWIHIDGGHLYQHVSNDLLLTIDSLAEEGVMVLDDFFEIRWPDVTAAILDFLREQQRPVPFLLVNRKLYCARSEEQANAYTEVFGNFLAANRDSIGQARWWHDVQMLGHRVLVSKMDLCEQLTSLESNE